GAGPEIVEQLLIRLRRARIVHEREAGQPRARRRERKRLWIVRLRVLDDDDLGLLRAEPEVDRLVDRVAGAERDHRRTLVAVEVRRGATGRRRLVSVRRNHFNGVLIVGADVEVAEQIVAGRVGLRRRDLVAVLLQIHRDVRDAWFAVVLFAVAGRTVVPD